MRTFLAQLNIAEMRYHADDPQMADFINALDEVNAAAEQAPGFIWRLKDDSNNATDIRIFGRDDLLVNLSMWESVAALRNYVVSDVHTKIMRRRTEWFLAAKQANLVMWWQASNEAPSVELAESKLQCLRTHGPSPAAFDFKTPFPPPKDEKG